MQIQTLNTQSNNARVIVYRFIHTSLALVLACLVTTVFATAAFAADTGVVNINTAGASELAQLPRVGPALSQRIVEFREENGKFKDAADLMLVRGIGEKTFELMEAYVTTQGETTLDTKVRTTDAEARLGKSGGSGKSEADDSKE